MKHSISKPIITAILAIAICAPASAGGVKAEAEALCNLICHVDQLIDRLKTIDCEVDNALAREYAWTDDSFRSVADSVLRNRMKLYLETRAMDITNKVLDETLAAKKISGVRHVSAGYFGDEYEAVGDEVTAYIDATITAQKSYIKLLQTEKEAVATALRTLGDVRKALCALQVRFDTGKWTTDGRELVAFLASSEFSATMESLVGHVKEIAATLEARRQAAAQARNASRQALFTNIASVVNQIQNAGPDATQAQILRIILSTFYGLPFPENPVFK